MLGDIVLKTAVVQVQEVSVVAIRPTIRMERGVYIADIENSIAASGNTVKTLLNQLPGVWATDSYISLNGKAVTVYINKRSYQVRRGAIGKIPEDLAFGDG
ncbi:MAG: hypothetical protein LBU03_06435 [Tannerellaceae bacterium]|jgi:hypothetical protein|nr:hypothetical protein [Tannerellaceae bacterium]